MLPPGWTSRCTCVMPTAAWGADGQKSFCRQVRGVEEFLQPALHRRGQTDKVSCPAPVWCPCQQPPSVCLYLVKDRIFCRITGKTFSVKSGGKSNCEKGNSLGTDIFFLYHDDVSLFCDLFCMARNSGWDVEGRVVQGCWRKAGRRRSEAT